jgi:phenylpropionate dioxygenase-like ring-hydroxylating dioxygenase large terminal subunit
MAYDFRRGTIVNPNAPAGSLEAKLPYVDNGTATLDPARYHAREFMALEWQRLWPKAWLIAGVSSDLPEIGSYCLFEIGSESFIISRTENGVRAFYNVCTHRGTRLVAQPYGRKSFHVCPFHAWRFNHRGELLGVTDRETFRDEVLCEARGLAEIRCEEYAGIVFVNMDEHAAQLRERIGLPPGYLEAYGIDQMKVVRHVQTEWAANWKIGVEAFYESYHLHVVHPETRAVMADLAVQYDLYPHGASRMIVPIGQMSPRVKDQDTLNDGLAYMLQTVGVDPASHQGNARGVRGAIARAKRENAKQAGLDYARFSDGQLTDSWATGIFPNVQIGCHPEGVFLMRFLPHPTDPERFYYNTMTLIRVSEDPHHKAPDWMGIPEGTDLSGRVRPPLEKFGVGEDGNLGQVLSQDAELLPEVQRGVRSRGFKGPLWGEQEQRLRHFHTELERYLTDDRVAGSRGA